MKRAHEMLVSIEAPRFPPALHGSESIVQLKVQAPGVGLESARVHGFSDVRTRAAQLWPLCHVRSMLILRILNDNCGKVGLVSALLLNALGLQFGSRTPTPLGLQRLGIERLIDRVPW